MRVAINQVKEGQASAAVSAGNTGALMATARFVLKTIKGVSRPAICTAMPTLQAGKNVLVLDLGANVDSPPEVLQQFASMGSVVSKTVIGIADPKVALLNVGAEDIKGSDKVKRAAALLENSALNYIGFVEGDEIYSGHVDVIATDGFEGNIALKSSEGTAKMIMSLLREEFGRSIFTKLAGMIAIPVFSALKKRIDPRRYNGAIMLGLNGIVVKSHGGTDAFGFEHAINEAANLARQDVLKELGRGVDSLLNGH